jgi:hypothetical protein
MSGTQLTHVEVVLLTWQQLPVELLGLSTDWVLTESRFYRIAQADITGELTIELLELFEQLKDEHLIADSCSRVVMAKRPIPHKSPNTEQAAGENTESELPDWVRAEIQVANAPSNG